MIVVAGSWAHRILSLQIFEYLSSFDRQLRHPRLAKVSTLQCLPFAVTLEAQLRVGAHPRLPYH